MGKKKSAKAMKSDSGGMVMEEEDALLTWGRAEMETASEGLKKQLLEMEEDKLPATYEDLLQLAQAHANVRVELHFDHALAVLVRIGLLEVSANTQPEERAAQAKARSMQWLKTVLDDPDFSDREAVESWTEKRMALLQENRENGRAVWLVRFMDSISFPVQTTETIFAQAVIRHLRARQLKESTFPFSLPGTARDVYSMLEKGQLHIVEHKIPPAEVISELRLRNFLEYSLADVESATTTNARRAIKVEVHKDILENPNKIDLGPTWQIYVVIAFVALFIYLRFW